MRTGRSYRFARATLRPVIRRVVTHRWSGLEHLPAEGGVVVVPNHLSFLDPFLVADLLDDQGREPRFLAKDELFGVPVVGAVLRGAGQIPVRRRTDDASRAYDAAVAAVRRGECVVVYAEGTLTRDPDLWPMRGRTGAVRIALTTGAPLVPLGQWGVQQVLPPWSKRLRLRPRRTVRLSLGPPVDLSELVGSEPTAEQLDAATERLMAAVTALVAELRGESPPATRYDPTTMGSPPRAGRSGRRDGRRARPMDHTAPWHRPEDDA